MKVICSSEAETFEFSFRFGQRLKKGAIICFLGDLGAGKTTFIKGLAAGVSGYPSEHVNSPTFVYLNIYEGDPVIYHFDLYRLRDIDEFLSMGFDEYMFMGGICCIEWSEKITALIPEEALFVKIEHVDQKARSIEVF